MTCFATSYRALALTVLAWVIGIMGAATLLFTIVVVAALVNMGMIR